MIYSLFFLFLTKANNAVNPNPNVPIIDVSPVLGFTTVPPWLVTFPIVLLPLSLGLVSFTPVLFSLPPRLVPFSPVLFSVPPGLVPFPPVLF